MKVISKFIKSKTSNQDECEDGIFISKDFIAIIDGVTDKTGLLFDKKRSGVFMKDIIIKSLLKADSNFSKNEMFSFLNNQISLFYKKEKLMKLLLDDKTKRAGASFIIFSKEKKEFWIVGDCQMIIDDKYYSFKKKIDCILSNIRSLVNNNYLLEGLIVDDLQSKDYGREFILPILRKQSL